MFNSNTMARLFATCLFVLCMVFRQGASLQCYQCASSLFPDCLDESAISIYAAPCDGGLTLCSTIATTIVMADGEEIHETSRQCATQHAEGCVVVEADGQSAETCTQTCDTDNCNSGPGKVIPTTTTTAAPEPSPVPTTTTTEAAPVITKKAASVPDTDDNAGGSAGIVTMNLFVLVLSALTVVLHL